MKISIWAVGKQFEFTHKQARATYEQLKELFERPSVSSPSVWTFTGDDTDPGQLTIWSGDFNGGSETVVGDGAGGKVGM